MTEHFNQLTPAEAERLAILAEEAGEIVQAVGKILRHGYESYHPKQEGVTNRQLLAYEVGDLMAVVFDMSLDHNDFSANTAAHQRDRKLARLKEGTLYLHHQREETR